MELNRNELLLKISNIVTVSSYIKGTLIFTLFTISKRGNEEVLFLGLFFVGIAVSVNILVFLITLAMLLYTNSKEYRSKFKIAIAFQLANIPIAAAYLYYVINDNGIIN